MEIFNLRGFLSPVFTPFHDNKERSLNLDVIPEYADFLNKSGIKGVLVNGTVGEAPSLSIEERNSIVEAWVNVTKTTKQTLMVQVGGASLPHVIQMTKHAASLNVDAILCLPDLFFKPTTVDELIDYLKIVSTAAPKTPLLYYHIPGFTGVNIDMAEFLSKAMKEIKTLVGIEFASQNLEEGAACLALSSSPVVFLGADRIISGAFQMGFDSVIAACLNLFPKWPQDILAYNNNGSFKEALDTQRKLTDAVNTITQNGFWLSSMKAAVKIVTHIDLGPVRAPLKPLEKSSYILIRNKLVTRGFLCDERK